MLTFARSFLLSCLFLILISLGSLFYRLGSLPFVGADEPRYARIAQEMQEAGRWVTPLLEHRPWLEKPPLYYWMTIPFYWLFGVSEFTARLGTALSALLSAFAIFWLGSKLWSRLTGLLSAGIFLTSVGVAAFGRAASTDMPVTACLTVALAFFGTALVEDRRVIWNAWCGWIFLGLGTLAKGPVALLLAAGIGLTFWCLDERGSAIRRWHVVSGLLIAAAVSLPWFWLAFRENGFAFIAIFFVNHNLARYITDIHHHTEPFYYFLLALPGLLLPWSGWLILLVPESVRDTLRGWRRWDRATVFVACWALFPLIFFSASRSKLPGYILPSIPPVALLLGRCLADWIAGGKRPRRVFAATFCQLLMMSALAVAYPLVMRRHFEMGWAEALPVSAILLIPAIFALLFSKKGRSEAAVQATLWQGVLLVLALTHFAFPAVGRFNSTRDIAGQIAAVRQAGEPLVTYHFFQHTLHYYTGYTVLDDLQDRESLLAFAREHPRFLIVTPAFGIPELQNLAGFSADLLGKQGKIRLLRLSRS